MDYPISSFASKPLKLSTTGLSFDGVLPLAYLRETAHFCFLGREEGEIILNDGGGEHADMKSGDSSGVIRGHTGRGNKAGGLIREIRVETEIGKREGTKQSLKNVGKVEKFVVEQVRRIFEEEFVWPSWRAFLL